MDDLELKNAWVKYSQTKDPDLKNDLIVHYLPLVKTTALKLTVNLPRHLSLDDLISSGIMGLISAIEKFDIQSGFQFKSFASYRIQGAMLDELRNLDWVPRTTRSKAKKLQAAYSAVEQSKGRFATDSEVAEFLGVDLDTFQTLLQETQVFSMVSLDAKIPSRSSKGSEDSALYDCVPDSSSLSPPERLFSQEQKALILSAIKDLSEQEQVVLSLYYYEDLTLKEIGHVLGVTESRVSQIHSKAVFRLRGRLTFSEVS